MHKLRNKMFLYIVLIGLLPMMLMCLFYYQSSVDKISEQLIDESKNIMERFESVINFKTNRLQNTADILFNDSELQKLLRETDLYGTDMIDVENRRRIGSILDKFFKVENELETIIVFFEKGGVYASGQQLNIIDPVRFKLEYGAVGETPGVITWMGTKTTLTTGQDNKKIVSGTLLRDTAYLNDMERLADVYMIFSNSFFEFEEVASGQEIDLSEKKENVYSTAIQKIYAYDKNANLIYSTDNIPDNNILSKAQLNVSQTIYSTEEGSIDVSIKNVRHRLVYYTAPITGWKFIRVVPYSVYYSRCMYIVGVMVVSFILLLLLWCILNFFIVRKIVSPIQDIVHAMEKVGNENLDVTLEIRSKDEFSIIGTQFNSMVARIKQLLARVQMEEKKRKESDVMMLEYQINPHFLYNTLAVIRIKTLNGDHKVAAEMLRILGRFLRNAIVGCTNLVCVEKEILNINDYISLLQLRYNNMIKISIDVDETAKKLQIPSMLLQPIIENAVMHGLADKFDTDVEAQLRISIIQNDDCVVLSVMDNGRGMSEFEQEKVLENIRSETKDSSRQSHHIGLKNIYKRVTMMFGEDYGIDIKSKLGEYTEVAVTLPVITTEETEKLKLHFKNDEL